MERLPKQPSDEEALSDTYIYKEIAGYQAVLTKDCSCRKKSFFTGIRPEYYSSESDTLQRWMVYKVNDDLYWAIHLNGLHILTFHLESACRCSVWGCTKYMRKSDGN